MPNGLFRNDARKGKWYGAYTDKNGKRHQFSTGTSALREAQRVFRDKLQAIWDEEDRPKLRTISLNSFTEEYLSSRRGERISESQLKELRASLTFLGRVVGDVPLHTISLQDCERFITRGWRADGWKSLYSARKHYQNLHAAFGTAVRWQHIRTNPFAEIKKPKPVERMPEVLSHRELSLLFDSLPDDRYHDRRLRNIVLLAVNSGLRLGELLHLERRDVDFAGKLLFVRSKRDWTPKSKKPRVVPLSEDAVRALRSQIAENARSERELVRSSVIIFPNPHGLPLTKPVIERPLKAKLIELFPGREFKPLHLFRHGYGSYLCERGVSLQEIQKIMGHSSVKTTEIYARLRGNDFSRALEALNAVPSLTRTSYTTLEALPEGLISEIGCVPIQTDMLSTTLRRNNLAQAATGFYSSERKEL